MKKGKVIFRVGLPGDGMTYVKLKCGLPCEIYSRPCGYFSPVSLWNKGKKQEFQDRKNYEVEAGGFFVPKSSSVSSSSKNKGTKK